MPYDPLLPAYDPATDTWVIGRVVYPEDMARLSTRAALATTTAAAAAAQSAATAAAINAIAALARPVPVAIGTTPGTAAAGDDARILAAQTATQVATAISGAADGTTISYTAGKLAVIGAVPSAASTVPSVTAARILLSDGTYLTGTQLQALLGSTGGAPTLTLTMPTGVQPGTSYIIAGTFTNDGTAPVLQVSTDAGAFGALPAGSTATGGTISLSMPGLSSGTHTVQVRDGNGVLSNTVSFTVAAAETLTVTTPGAQVAGTAFVVSGTYANGTPATLDYSLDGTTWTASTGAAPATGTYSIPGVVVAAANAAQTVRVRDHGAQSVVGVSASFAVTAAAGGTYPALTMTGATYAAAPTGFGQQLTGGSGTATITLPAGTSWGIEADFTASVPPNADIRFIGTSDGQFTFEINNSGHINAIFGGYRSGSSTVVTDGAKHKLAIFYNSTGSGAPGTALYVDGVQVSANNYSANPANPAITVQTYAGAAVDNVRFSNNLRIAAAYTPSTTPLTRDANTIVLYPLDGSGVSQ